MNAKYYRYNFLSVDSENGYTIQDVYKMSPTSEDVVTLKYGSWDLQNGISVSERIIWKRRSNFNGFQIKYVHLNLFPFKYLASNTSFCS